MVSRLFKGASFMLNLNQRAWERVQRLCNQPRRWRVQVHQRGEVRVVDLGVEAPGGLEAGLELARVCLADLAQVNLVPQEQSPLGVPQVSVFTDHPLWACMGSQYAGWKVEGPGFFAMASGPLRLLVQKEELLRHYGLQEQSPVGIGVLESDHLPKEEVCRQIAQQAQLPPQQVALLVAPTGSLAGAVQVVARSAETALHKLHELGFDLRRVQAAWGTAPMVPVPRDGLEALGRTNDAILYGAQVTLWVDATWSELQPVAEQLPSSASLDYGKPFVEIFRRYEGDFYRIDPLLFSPAQVTLCTLRDGKSHTVGQVNWEVLRRSLGRET